MGLQVNGRVHQWSQELIGECMDLQVNGRVHKWSHELIWEHGFTGEWTSSSVITRVNRRVHGFTGEWASSFVITWFIGDCMGLYVRVWAYRWVHKYMDKWMHWGSCLLASSSSSFPYFHSPHVFEFSRSSPFIFFTYILLNVLPILSTVL